LPHFFLPLDLLVITHHLAILQSCTYYQSQDGLGSGTTRLCFVIGGTDCAVNHEERRKDRKARKVVDIII
jgi:hypothetical protein